MKGFDELSDELYKDGDVHVLRRVSVIVRHRRTEEAEPAEVEDLQAITFQFDRFFFNMVCGAEFDEVELLVDKQVRWPDLVISNVSDQSPWRDLVDDYFLSDFWLMKNHRGYHDAMQLRFRSVDRTHSSERVFQFEAIASEFFLSRVERDSWHYDAFAHFPDD